MSQSRRCFSRIVYFSLGLGGGSFILYMLTTKLLSATVNDILVDDLLKQISADDNIYQPSNAAEAYNLYKELELAESRLLSRQVRVLCQVMTNNRFHNDRVIAVKKTWGRHCNILVFISDQADAKIPTVDVKVKKEKKGVWKMTVESFKYINTQYAGQFDWVFKCDDDTFAIMEHMRLFLKDYDPNKLSFFGHHLKSLTTYMAGGSGYVISNATLQHFLTEGLSGKHKNCSEFDDVWEDVQMGHCMTSLGVPYVDSRNSNGRQRFFPEPVSFHTDDMTKSGEPFKWYNESSYYPVHFGLTCCADDVISFHHYTHRDMYMLEYMTYGMKHPEPLLLQP